MNPPILLYDHLRGNLRIVYAHTMHIQGYVPHHPLSSLHPERLPFSAHGPFLHISALRPLQTPPLESPNIASSPRLRHSDPWPAKYGQRDATNPFRRPLIAPPSQASAFPSPLPPAFSPRYPGVLAPTLRDRRTWHRRFQRSGRIHRRTGWSVAG